MGFSMGKENLSAIKGDTDSVQYTENPNISCTSPLHGCTKKRPRRGQVSESYSYYSMRSTRTLVTYKYFFQNYRFDCWSCALKDDFQYCSVILRKFYNKSKHHYSSYLTCSYKQNILIPTLRTIWSAYYAYFINFHLSKPGSSIS